MGSKTFPRKSITIKIQKLLDELRVVYPDMQFNEAAEREIIDELAAKAGRLPEDFYALYLIHDGFSGPHELSLGGCAEIAEEWRKERELDAEIQMPATLISLADEPPEGLYLDCETDSDGVEHGLVLQVEDQSVPLAATISEYMEYIIDLGKAGRSVHCEEFGFYVQGSRSELRDKLSKLVATIRRDQIESTNALLAAAERGDLNEIARMVAGGADINSVNTNGYNVVAIASEKKNFASIPELIKMGANPGIVPEWSPLQEFAYHGDHEAVRSLLAAGIPIGAFAAGTTPPLQLAAAESYGRYMDDIVRDYPAIVKILIEKGADVNFSISGRVTPLSEAAQHASKEMIQTLLEHGADPNGIAIDEYEESALMRVGRRTEDAKEQSVKIAELLIKAGADLEASNWEGTPLNFAAANDQPDLVRFLIEAGADPTVLPDSGD